MTGQQFPPEVRIYLQAEALRRAFPGWSIAVQAWAGHRARIEAVNQEGGGLYALISSDPAELWAELAALGLGAPVQGPGAAKPRSYP